MLKAIACALTDLSHLFFPHNCLGCGSDVLQPDAELCAKCFADLPVTGFMANANNPVEKIFFGRIPVQQAGSAFYFTKNAVIQRMMIQLKYRGNKAAGFYLGKILGGQLKECGRFDGVDVIIPLPLNPKKERKRGYNQALVIAEGVVAEWQRPIINKAVARRLFTETQTQKGRVDRWQNMKDVFTITNTEDLLNKHVLLIDDVVTTGASLDACATAILKVPGTKISIATIAYTI